VSSTFRSLRVRNYRIYFLSGLVSNTGTWMQRVAQDWLGLLVLSGIAQIWQVYVLAFLMGIGAAIDNPARQSFMVEWVGRDDLPNAVALNSSSFNAARLLGPAMPAS
jgi:MFS family permease